MNFLVTPTFKWRDFFCCINASAIGKPLYLDEITKKQLRVCVAKKHVQRGQGVWRANESNKSRRQVGKENIEDDG